MRKAEFIFTLFDNGYGLTLEQIEDIENNLPETFPDGLIDDLMGDNGMDRNEAHQIAMEQARTVFINGLRDAEDMLDLRDFLNRHLFKAPKVNDMQVYHTMYLK